MRKLGPVLAALALGSLCAPLLAEPAAHAAVDHQRLGGVRVAIAPGTRQVVTVNHTGGFHARVAFWVLRQGEWKRVLGARDGRIGYGGLVAPRKRHQGTGTTPLGTVRLISAFGKHPRADGWDLPYRHVRKGDYWVEDNGSRFYNRYRNKSQGGFRWWLPADAENSSERLRDFPVQYEYSVVTSYNLGQVRHRGAGIFLHVNGSGATAGCVSAPRAFIRQLMIRLDPARHPVMAVGR
jgi:L,D-peptidoglycan transpeptidase YkuD (ErfK/YbiS/YcfS/YnhG family)